MGAECGRTAVRRLPDPRDAGSVRADLWLSHGGSPSVGKCACTGYGVVPLPGSSETVWTGALIECQDEWMTQPKPPCLFCGQTGKLSLEHLLAKHWRSLSGPERGVITHIGYSTDPETGAIKEHKGEKEGMYFDKKTSGVCEACNTIWMSQLEMAVAQPIASIAEPKRDSSTMILPNARVARDLVRWAAKTAIVIERAHDGEVITSPELATAVLNDQDVLPYFHAWIRRLEPHGVWRDSTRHLTFPTPEGDRHVRMCLYSIHRCLVITLYCRDEPSDAWLTDLDPSQFFGPEIHEARMLPWGPPLPGPNVAWIKDRFAAWLGEKSASSLLRRFEAADAGGRERLALWMSGAARRPPT